MMPRARVEGVTTSELNDETVVYDLHRHRVHRLNRTAALVWKRCDGQNSVADIAAAIGRELSAPSSEELVHQALDQLHRAHLLEGRERLSRREFGQHAGLTGALLVLAPVVTSMVAPTAAHAQSGKTLKNGDKGGLSKTSKADTGNKGYKGDGGGGGKGDSDKGDKGGGGSKSKSEGHNVEVKVDKDKGVSGKVGTELKSDNGKDKGDSKKIEVEVQGGNGKDKEKEKGVTAKVDLESKGGGNGQDKGAEGKGSDMKAESESKGGGGDKDKGDKGGGGKGK